MDINCGVCAFYRPVVDKSGLCQFTGMQEIVVEAYDKCRLFEKKRG